MPPKHPAGWYKFVDTKTHFVDNNQFVSICGHFVLSTYAYEMRGDKQGRCKHCVKMVDG